MTKDDFEKVLKDYYEALGCKKIKVDVSQYPEIKVEVTMPLALPEIIISFDIDK